MCISQSKISAAAPIKLPSCVRELKNQCEAASRSMRRHLIVQHHYHDHSNDPVPTGPQVQEVVDDCAVNHNAFPLKLYEMLTVIERDGFSDVVSWQPHGRCFVVHKADEFRAILPRYFKLSKVASFQRQLNLYGFMRLTRGLDKGGYYHELFLRGKPYLAQKIQRVKVKGTGVRAKSNPNQEPDFWNMPWSMTTPHSKTSSTPLHETTQPSTDTMMNPLLVTSSMQRAEDCTTSVVSQDEDHEAQQVTYCDEMIPDPRPLHPMIHAVDVRAPMQIPSFGMDPVEDTLVTSWGMPFYYLPRPEGSLPPDAYHGGKVTCIDDDLDKILGDMDFAEVMKDLLHDSEHQTFADLLERAAA